MNTNPHSFRSWLARSGLFAALVLCAVTAGCHGDEHGQEAATGSSCPSGPAASTLTYANFGKAFFDGYCQRCHASAVTGAARNGAPTDHVFDTRTDIFTNKEHIDENAAAGPNAVNTAMPPSAPTPSLAEREKLGEWLACGAPE